MKRAANVVPRRSMRIDHLSLFFGEDGLPVDVSVEFANGDSIQATAIEMVPVVGNDSPQLYRISFAPLVPDVKLDVFFGRARTTNNAAAMEGEV